MTLTTDILVVKGLAESREVVYAKGGAAEFRGLFGEKQ